MRGAKQKEMFELSDLRRETFTFGPSVCFSPGGGGGDLIFFYTYVGSGKCFCSKF